MIVIGSVTITMAAIPILGLLALLGLVALIVTRRGTLVAKARQQAKDARSRVLRDDQVLEQQLVDSLVGGKSLPDATAAFLSGRESLLPGASPDRPGHWSGEELERRCRRDVAESTDAINRRLLVQAAAGGLSLVAACVIGVCVLYGLHTPQESPEDSMPARPIVVPHKDSESEPDSDPFPPLSPETFRPPRSSAPVPDRSEEHDPIPEQPADPPRTLVPATPNLHNQEKTPMHEPKTNGNGQKVASSFSARPLPDRNVSSQIMRRGSCNASMTHMDERSFDDVSLTVFRLIRDEQESQTGQPVDFDEVDTRAIARSASLALQAHPLVAETGPDDLGRRAELLRELYSDRPSKMKRHFTGQLRQEVEQVVSRVIQEFNRQMECAPYALETVLNEASSALDGMVYHDPDPRAYAKFKNAVNAKLQIESDTSTFPPQTRERVLAALGKHIAESFNDSLEALAQLAANDAVRNGAVERLRPTIEELKRVTAEIRTSEENVVRSLEKERTEGYHRHAVSASSNLVRLDGPTEQDLLSCLMDRLSCENRRELAKRSLEKLTDRLNEVAKQRYPFISTPAGPTTLLSRMAPGDIAGTLRQLLHEIIGDASSVYSAVRAKGTSAAVEDLFSRAAPLCRLRSRDRAIFNVEPAKKTVVRLPRPLGAEDQQTYEDLRDAFGTIPNCECVDAPAGDREIIVIRTTVGWPIAIESNHETLLAYYATAEKVHHRPHLFSVVPGAETGRPLDELKKIFGEFERA